MALSTIQLQIKDASGSIKNIKQLVDTSGNILNISALQDTDGNLISSENGLPVILTTDSSNSYQFAMKIAPTTTLAIGTVYAAIRNGGSKTIYIDEFMIKQDFTGVASASASDYELVSFANGTAIVGGLVPNIGKRKSTNALPTLDVKFLNTGGLTVTGASIASNGLIIGHSNQFLINANYRLDLKQNPMILAPGEGIIFRALSLIRAGSNNYITCLFREI